MKSKISTIRRVFAPDEEAFLEIGESLDTPNLIEIRTVTDYSKEYYGKVGFSMTPEEAKLVGEALVKASDELKEAKSKFYDAI